MRLRDRLVSIVTLAAVALLASATPAFAQAPPTRPAPASPESAAAWRTLFDADLAAAADAIRTGYIYAIRGGAEWDALFARQLAQARAEAPRVKDYASYRAVLQHFVVGFDDAHFSAYFSVVQVQARWPRFTLRYRGGRYVVATSALAEVPVRADVGSCDGRPVDAWLDELSEVLGGPRGRETTRAVLAPQFLVDRGNPLRSLPRVCSIGGRDVPLAWSAAEGSVLPPEPMRTGDSEKTVRDPGWSSREFGGNGAWLRMGAMMMTSKPEAKQAHALIARVPQFREKGVIVLDVRGNPGGSYEWFMAFLRSLYGAKYADYYARARLEIANVYYAFPGAPVPRAGQGPRPPDPFDTPEDPQTAHVFDDAKVESLPDGGHLLSARAPIRSIRFPSRAPANPVKARVYVLADYACGSACLSFTDELMRFPGVTLLGTETHVDRRSGGGIAAALPSGLARIGMGQLVRDGRARGENEVWVPGEAYRYPGDIADTAAVERWILETVVPGDVAAGAWKQAASLQGPTKKQGGPRAACAESRCSEGGRESPAT